MTSLARTEANRRNAQKSTGPKTVEGKARSRMNALQHGLRAEVIILPTEDPSDFDRHLGAWMNDWKPPTETRRFLVERAAVAAWRLNRCVRVETGRLSDRVQSALQAWDKSQTRQLDQITSMFPLKPAETIARLEQTQGGVGRLIDLWIEIMNALETPNGWLDEVYHHQLFVNLMGYKLTDSTEIACELVKASRQLLLRNRPQLATPGESSFTDAQASQFTETVLASIEAKFKILDEIYATLPDEVAARTRQAEQVAFEPRPEDVPFHRYEARHEREARAAINLLMKLEKSGEDLAGLEASEANVEPQPSTVPTEAKVAPEAASVPTEAKVESPGEPVPATEPNVFVSIEQALSITKADRDRDGRTWANVDMPEGSDLPRSI